MPSPQPALQETRLEGVVATRAPKNGVLHFELEVEGKRYHCVDATGHMGAFSVLAGQHVACDGRWSPAVLDLFEVAHIDKPA